jgi:hypothetical protein
MGLGNSKTDMEWPRSENWRQDRDYSLANLPWSVRTVWSDSWTLHQRLHFRQVRIQEDHDQVIDSNDWNDLHPILCVKHPNSPRRRHFARSTVGCLPNSHHSLRFRNCTCEDQSVPHNLSQSMLGDRTIDSCWRPKIVSFTQ